jgi:hypothetical protein
MTEAEYKKLRLKGMKVELFKGVKENVLGEVKEEPRVVNESGQEKGEESESIKWARSKGIIRSVSKSK